jgi:hypothetical protein
LEESQDAAARPSNKPNGIFEAIVHVFDPALVFVYRHAVLARGFVLACPAWW